MYRLDINIDVFFTNHLFMYIFIYSFIDKFIYLFIYLLRLQHLP